VTHVLMDECFIQVWHILPLCVCRRPFAQLRGIISATQQECSGPVSAALWMSGPNSHNLGMGCQHMCNARHATSGTAVYDGAPQRAQGWNLFKPRQVEVITAATLRLGIMSSFCSRRPSEQQGNRDHQPWQCKFIAHQKALLPCLCAMRPLKHAPLRDAAPRQKHAGETSTAAPTQIAFQQNRVSREGGKCSLGTGGARSWALPLVDDGQRRLLLSRVVQCLECGLELLVPLLVGRYALHLFITKCTLLTLAAQLSIS
jgi:hypothetical protein